MLVKKPLHSHPSWGNYSGNGGPRLRLPWDVLHRIQMGALHTTYAVGQEQSSPMQPGVLGHLPSITAQTRLQRRS